jgi:hypothetical protein
MNLRKMQNEKRTENLNLRNTRVLKSTKSAFDETYNQWASDFIKLGGSPSKTKYAVFLIEKSLGVHQAQEA